jgi:MFS family permease
VSANEPPAELAKSIISAFAARAPRRVTWRQWYMVAALTLLYIYAQIDGSAIILMVDPIKRDLGVSDTAMSLLLGLSFAAFYSILGLPAGYLVDRIARRPIIGIGVVLWSSMTMGCGLAQTYWQLFLGRCGIGLGEAAITPASYSLIRDAFPPEQRGRAFGMFTAGTYIGAAAAVMLTGALLGLYGSGRLAAIPFVGGLRPWQGALFTIGAIGVPLALLVLTFREPTRTEAARDEGVHFAEALSHIRANWRPYLPLAGFVTCFYMVAISYGSWMPTIIARTWHLPPQQIGLFFGGCLLICAPIGAWGGGYLIDWLTRRGRRDAAQIVGLWITAIFIPFGVAAPIVPGVGEMFFALAAQLLVAGAYNPVAASILAQITPQRLMGKVTAIYLLVFTLLGRGLGPLIVAAISDAFYSGPQALGFALGTAAAILMAAALVAITLLLRRSRLAA